MVCVDYFLIQVFVVRDIQEAINKQQASGIKGTFAQGNLCRVFWQCFGSITKGINDLVCKLVVNQGCSDVRVMFDSGIAQDGAIDKHCAGDWGRYRFGSEFGFGFGPFLRIDRRRKILKLSQIED